MCSMLTKPGGFVWIKVLKLLIKIEQIYFARISQNIAFRISYILYSSKQSANIQMSFCNKDLKINELVVFVFLH